MERERDSDAMMSQPMTGQTTQSEPSAWAIGWIAFAGLMMILGGVWWITAGIIALFDDNFYVVTRNYVFSFDTTSWGWIHLILGTVSVLAGFYLFTGAVWARIVGVTVAVLAAIVAFAWIPYYPVFAIILVAVSAAVIWALTVHGRDITEV